MLPAQWPPKPLHLWALFAEASQKQSSACPLPPAWKRMALQNSHICPSVMCRSPRGIRGLRVSVLPEYLVQPQMQTRRLILETSNPRLRDPNSKVGIRYSSGATWSRYLTERQLREHYNHATWSRPGSLIGALETLSLVNLTRSSCPTACDGAKRPARTTW
jgi:hypothetical protein